MKRKILSLALTVVLALSLAAPAVAYTTPDFADLPADNWAYESVMRMADQGFIRGTGGGNYSPELKVSAAQFLTLVGRVVFPETKVTEEDIWYGPYVAAVKDGGLLTGSQVDTNNVEAEISRYDMAVILRAAAKKLGKTETLAQQSQVTDYGAIPNMYTEAVLAVYGMGLIKGDQAGNFNGSNTMQRNELATVIDRLVALKGPGSTTEPEKPDEPEGPLEPEIVDMPKDEEMATYKVFISLAKIDHVLGAPAYNTKHYLPDVPIKLYYTDDGGETATLIAEGMTNPLPEHGRPDDVEFNFEAPKSWDTFQEGKGFFVSAEAEYEGQRLVTSDLRTDGRAYVECHRGAANGRTGWDVELTPPEGLKIHFTFAGTAETESEAIPVPGTVIQLCLKDGTVVGETVAGANGKFKMDCAVDVLDGVLDVRTEMYKIVAHGELNGVPMSKPMTYFGTDETMLYTLDRLGGNPHSLNFSEGSFHVRLRKN